MNIHIIDDDYKNDLIIALVNQGYAVYYDQYNKTVSFQVTGDELIELEDNFPLIKEKDISEIVIDEEEIEDEVS